ncbi:MAG: UDP-N-acetylmuramate dehydrogenase [Pseudomonadales bacterium]
MSTEFLSISNTLGVPAVAERLVVVRSERQLLKVLGNMRRQAGGGDLTVLGGGSNVVLLERVPGTVCLMRTRGCRLAPGPAGGAELTVAAGERWHDLVRYSLGQGLAGLENLALIPGSVGAAPIQNIGAYGVELADRFVRLRAVDRDTGEIRMLDHAACRFGYRDSCFKGGDGARLVILEVTLRLHAARGAATVVEYPDLQAELARLGRSTPSPVDVAEAVTRVRRRKLPDPRWVPNVGSFFKNPEVSPAEAEALSLRITGLSRRAGTAGRIKLAAAQLIEAAGWKGRVVGAVGVWQRQPLVLVNRGGARGRDVLALSEDIRRDVAERFGVRLEREPQVLGQD